MRGAWIEIRMLLMLDCNKSQSLPVRGAWIEMAFLRFVSTAFASLPVRGAWIEMSVSGMPAVSHGASLPVRGAWIEIATGAHRAGSSAVAPRAGSVD